MLKDTVYVQVSTTVATKKDAERIAACLADRKLSACTQIAGPIESIYRWNGKRERAKEWLCIIKTKKILSVLLEKVLKEIHPYTLPEIIVTPIVGGSDEYLTWMGQQF